MLLAPYLSRSSIKSVWFQSAGLGPIIDILPNKILYTWGISSNEVFLKNFPILVIYWSGFSNRWVGQSLGVSILIVLNFQILNNFLFLPTRSCLNNTGPFELHLMIMAIIIINGMRSIPPISDSRKSIKPLKNLYILYSYVLIFWFVNLICWNKFFNKFFHMCCFFVCFFI